MAEISQDQLNFVGGPESLKDMMELVDRRTEQLQSEANEKNRQRKLELIRLSKEILMENARFKSADEKEVSAQDVINLANSLSEYINS